MKKLASTFVQLLCALLLLVGSVFGASLSQSKAALAESGQAFSISPPLVELKADPGQTVTAKIKLTNLSKDTFSMHAQYNDFGAKNETGEPNIFFDDTQQSLPYSLRGWIADIEPFDLQSKETKTSTFSINVPKNAEPGSHYAVIRFTGNTAEGDNGNVSLSASIGTLVFLQVSGDIKESASIADFYSANAKFEKTGFLENGPVGFVARVQNKGNVHIKPTGTITVTDTFGKQVATLRINGDPNDPKNPPKSVLPSSIRRFNETLDTTWMFGRYTAKLDVSYGNSGQHLHSTTTFWVVPYKLIGVMLLALVALFFVLRFIIKKYNAYIIRQARGKKL